ncbi:MAG: hypothetical protein O7C98_03130 [Planctomycetota bacterium]|nr:hypothetical protein [Planctomycetota bacterium]
MRRSLAACVMAAVFACPGAAQDGGGRPQPPPLVKFKPPTLQEIERSIERGVTWLHSAQLEDGSWGPCRPGGVYGQPDSAPSVGYHVGPTAFSLFALAKCGVRRTDPLMKKALDWLRKRDAAALYKDGGYRRGEWTNYTSYESAAVILMLCALYEDDAPKPAPKKKPRKKRRKKKEKQAPRRPAGPWAPPAGSAWSEADWRWLHDRVQHLVVDTDHENACQVPGLGWGYFGWRDNAYCDVSATQFALLALREAAHAGYPVNKVAPKAWGWALRYLKGMQYEHGAFAYNTEHAWNAGLTAAGVASLAICREQMRLANDKPPEWVDAAIKRGLGRMSELFDVRQNRSARGGNSGYHYYHLYGIERVGALTGRKEFGAKDWYVRGAAYLLANQREDGKWYDPSCMRPRDVLGTCFALLFLKKATPPEYTTGE